MNIISETLKNTIIITAFVFVMMLIIEYINILTKGVLQEKLIRVKWARYLAAVILGALPGDLGSFIAVTLYGHRIISFGALLTTLIIATGDAAYVMLAVMPRDSFILTGILILIGVPAGILTDLILKKFGNKKPAKCGEFKNAIAEKCVCYPKGEIILQWKNCSLARGALTITLLSVIGFYVIGKGIFNEWDWLRIVVPALSGIALFIIATVPDHFLEQHLWRHIVLKHIPRIFLWIFGTLILVHFIVEYSGLYEYIQESKSMLGIAGLTGLIPSPAPQLIFVTMFEKGLIPASILLTSSIIQDCHGSLPLLAYSAKDFIIIKIIKLILGMSVGYVLLCVGY